MHPFKSSQRLRKDRQPSDTPPGLESRRRIRLDQVRNDWTFDSSPADVLRQVNEHGCYHVHAPASTREPSEVQTRPSEASSADDIDHQDSGLIDPDDIDEWCARTFGDSDLSSSDDEMPEATTPARSCSARRHARIADEARWNPGLAHWTAQRDIWCCARSSSLTPERPPLVPRFPAAPLPTLPTASTVTLLPTLYRRIVQSSERPNTPINLSLMLSALVQGWKADGEWPVAASPVLTRDPHKAKNAEYARAVEKGLSLGVAVKALRGVGRKSARGGKDMEKRADVVRDGDGKSETSASGDTAGSHGRVKRGVESVKLALRRSWGHGGEAGGDVAAAAA